MQTETNSLVIFTKAALMLAEADTIQKAKELKSLALTAADWAKRKGMGEEAIQHCRSYAMRAEIKLGEMLAATSEDRTRETRGGDRKSKSPEVTLKPTLSDLGLTKRESSEAQMLAGAAADKQEDVISGKTTRADVRREKKRKEIIERLEDVKTKEVKKVEGVYDVIVIDPPWPMEKIEREVRPNQTKFDYPTMNENEISNLKIPFSKDCHVWLWTTHKFLPMAFRLLDVWALKYVCAFVWHKPGGFQPIGLPQYNCEFVLYARHGSPKFTDTKNLPVCFSAPRGGHSEKPDEFYSTICRVTAGRRLDMFSRRVIEGFDGWGLESK
jgi:N6-adenosine-specific RNA methylase IME4